MSALLLAWLLMMATHEFGHMIHAWLSGGIVTHIVLHPLAISRTDVDPNPAPQFVAWGGAVWGSLIPLLIWGISRRFDKKLHSFLQFFLGFCLVANGVYLATDVFYLGGDGREMIQNGCPSWIPVTVGIPLAIAGFFSWHGLGPQFGIGKHATPIKLRMTVILVGLLVVVISIESIFFSAK